MRREELLDIPLNEQSVQGSKKGRTLSKKLTLFGFVFVVGAVCALAFVYPRPEAQQAIEGQIINRKMHSNLMQQYSRVLSVEITPNGAKMPKES